MLVNVLGALGEFAKIPANKVNIHRCGGIKLLIKLLRRTNQASHVFPSCYVNKILKTLPLLCQYIHKHFVSFYQALLINVTKAVGSCAMDMTNMA